MVIIILTLLILAISGITTIPFSIGLLAVSAVLFRKSWVFFLALGLGLFLDLIFIRPLGYTSLVLTVFVFMIFLYERKFETQTAVFVFFATFLGSTVYLNIFDSQNIILQALVSSFFAVLFFRLLNLKFKVQNEKSQFKV